jgi:hypothetical protein
LFLIQTHQKSKVTNIMNSSVIKDEIVGARNIRSIFTMIVLFLAGLGFFLAGLSSYLNINLLLSQIPAK